MEKIAISKFTAQCTAIIDAIAETGQPVTITRHGKAVAEIVPARAGSQGKRISGGMAGSLEINGDIVDTSDLWDEEAWLRGWDEVERQADEREKEREQKQERRKQRRKT